jgi:hypothetical protein
MAENRTLLDQPAGGLLQQLRNPAQLWSSIRDYLGGRHRRGREPIVDPAGLRTFLETRASFVAQMSLYGYLRTRAGSRYPELFQDDAFVASINIAKWQMWLACLSDISVYAGGSLVRRAPEAAPRIAPLMHRLVTEILAETGLPGDAGPDFAPGAERILTRLALTDWTTVEDDGSAFTESPAALVRWSPIIDDLKKLDEPIVLNSVRFRWQEVRRHFRDQLDAQSVLAADESRAP